jgi:HD-GYP domain-containing protein (c-di-GMP phosphodiesterase class II)
MGGMMTEGLFVSTNSRYISQISQGTYTLSLLATGGNVDVVIYDIRVDKPCNICPGDKPGLMEFYYVLEGTAVLKLESGDKVLGKGEYFYVYNLKSIINFATLNGAKLLCVTSPPLFKYLLEYHEGLCKLLEDVEAKDLYTYNHGYRVQMYSVKIAEKLGLPQRSIYTLQVASLFHDIGKHFVPDEILKKPGKLTIEEYECIKKHSADSGRLLKEKFEEDILLAAEQHHERLDGTGYPHGLKGAQIRPEARIIAVADAYDAMTSDRAYRRAKRPEEAIGELETLAAKFDEAAVRALKEILIENGTIAS